MKMNVLSSTSTTEIIPTEKRRGRPSTGKVKLFTERQAAYRQRKERKRVVGQYDLNMLIDSNAKYALERLAKYTQITPSEMLELLIHEADSTIIKDIKNDPAEWELYFS